MPLLSYGPLPTVSKRETKLLNLAPNGALKATSTKFFFCILQDDEDMEDSMYHEKRVGFISDVDEEDERKTPLRRRDTPHHKKGKRIVISDSEKDKVLEILAQKTQPDGDVSSCLICVFIVFC